jgi:DNA repair ATPase RecN
VTNNNNVLLIDNNKSTHADRLDPKNAIKINRIKDTYIDFLQKQNEDHNKLNFNLDSNNKKLLNRCSSLIKDNISLNKILNEKSNRLNKIVQENINIKEQLDKIIFNNNKSEQKLKYYEEQLEYYQINNDNYKKIVDELKEQIQKLNINLNQINNRNEQEIKEVEEKYENKIESIKNDMNKEISELKKKNEEKINELNEEIKNLKFQNKELTKELESKDGVIKIMYKDNQNLINQNKLNIIKLEHNSKQIQDLNKILQTKETMINSLKTKDTESDKLFLSKSNSCSYMKLEGSDFLSENLTKLLNDNEENKMKIEYLHDKIKNMAEIEKKCDELIEKSSSSGKVSYKIRSVGNSRERRYDNQSYYESKNTKKNILKK